MRSKLFGFALAILAALPPVAVDADTLQERLQAFAEKNLPDRYRDPTGELHYYDKKQVTYRTCSGLDVNGHTIVIMTIVRTQEHIQQTYSMSGLVSETPVDTPPC